MSMKKEDRLSSLPDDILTKILSCLPINSAAASSVLSTRWRHLWTGVTSFVVLSETGKEDEDDDDDILYLQKLIKLTSLKLHKFDIKLKSVTIHSKPNIKRDQISCFREVCRRDVENISILCPGERNRYILYVPDFVFRTKSLVSLSLGFMYIRFDMPENVAIQLPNLKNLHLRHLSHIPLWLETLCRCSPVLEVIDLKFIFLDTELELEPQPRIAVNIFGTNLKSLRIETHYYVIQTHRNRFFIDAPRLEYLSILDGSSCYYLSQNPTTLVETSVDLIRSTSETAMVGDDDYRQDMGKFVRRMCNVSNNLHLTLERNSNIIGYVNDHGVIFGNLASLTLTLEKFGLIVWKDLLVCLQCFPNLKNLVVLHYWLKNNDDVAVEDVSWYAPSDELPLPADCLVNKVKRITIRGLFGLSDELCLIAYLVSNATVLEELAIRVNIQDVESKEARLRMGCQFCKSLFDLPRASSTCLITFTTVDMLALSIHYQHGILRYQVYNLR